MCVLTWSRDELIGLRSADVKLSTQVRSVVNRAGCGRRGCRAGRHTQSRRCAVETETESSLGIPVVISHYRRRQHIKVLHRRETVLIEVELQRHDNMSTGVDNLLFAERQLSSSINRTTHELDSRSNRTACDGELSPTQSSTQSVYGELPSMLSSWLSEADCDLTDDCFIMSDLSAIPVIIGNRTQRRQQSLCK